MATKKIIKAGDRTIIASTHGDFTEISNRVPNREASLALDLIRGDKSDRPAGAVVDRAFRIAQLTYAHIKENRMEAPFPFAKVYDEDA